MSILKIEAFSGLSGDMFLGALAELTGAYDELQKLPGKLHLDKVEVKITEVEKAGIACKHIKILDRNEYENHTHSHDHHHIDEHQSHDFPKEDHNHTHSHEHTHSHDHGDHSHSHSHDHSHSHGDHEHTHSHSHSHSHDDHSHSHTHSHAHHRHLADIEKIIDGGHLTANAKKIAKEIFYLLGTAEAKVHGVDIQKIHFHEVGAIDSILDIVGSAFLLDKLNITSAVSTAICTGHGFVMADHGRMPIPAPATKELLLSIPTYAGKAQGEMTTPTGAAILKYLNPSFEIPTLTEQKIGHGPGEKDFEHPNVLRLSICNSVNEDMEKIHMVETNVDDMSSELLGNDFQNGLLSVGALDFYYTQIIMKKGRPGTLISVFVTSDKLQAVTDYLLENTTTIGVRSYPTSRKLLKRHLKSMKTSLGDVDVKEVELPSGKKRTTLEYESCKKLAEKHQKSIAEIYTLLQKEL